MKALFFGVAYWWKKNLISRHVNHKSEGFKENVLQMVFHLSFWHLENNKIFFIYSRLAFHKC